MLPPERKDTTDVTPGDYADEQVSRETPTAPVPPTIPPVLAFLEKQGIDPAASHSHSYSSTSFQASSSPRSHATVTVHEERTQDGKIVHQSNRTYEGSPSDVLKQLDNDEREHLSSHLITTHANLLKEVEELEDAGVSRKDAVELLMEEALQKDPDGFNLVKLAIVAVQLVVVAVMLYFMFKLFG